MGRKIAKKQPILIILARLHRGFLLIRMDRHDARYEF